MNIKEFIDNNGSFDVLIGFSQGSVMTTILLGLNIFNFKFCIIGGSYEITDNLYNEINTQTLHIWGLNDSIVIHERSKK